MKEVDKLSIDNEINYEEFYKGMGEFFNKTVKAWQSYISYEFIKGIRLSELQKRVLNADNSQLLINGSGGSGKSTVLLYKLIKSMIEEKEPKKFLYISYNQILIDDTKKRANKYPEFEKFKNNHHKVDICTFHQFAANILKDLGYPEVKDLNINYKTIERMRGNSARRVASILHKYTEGELYPKLNLDERLYKTHDFTFVRDEILWMKANEYIRLEDYLECERAGRGNTPRLTKNQRKTIFKIYEDYREQARNRKWTETNIDLEDYALTLIGKFHEIPESKKYDYIFIDEVQDLDAAQIKLLAMLSPKFLIMAGDSKQKIYKKTPHSYASLGIDVKNNNRNLRENHRSTEEIMKLANSLKFNDILKEQSIISYKNKGQKPKILSFANPQKAMKHIGEKILEIQKSEPNSNIAIITREEESISCGNHSNIRKYLGRYSSIIGIEQYNKKFEFGNQKQVIFTDLFNVKGLEFDYVFLLHFDRYHYPSKKEIEKLSKYLSDKETRNKYEDSEIKDYEDLINIEKKRLYVGITRAKKELELICFAKTERDVSPFIKDFNREDYEYKFYKR